MKTKKTTKEKLDYYKSRELEKFNKEFIKSQNKK